MIEKQVGKLVRDGVPQQIINNGQTPNIRRLNGDQFLPALKDKLVEEATEVSEAKTKTDIVAELADMQEVRDAMLGLLGVTQEEVDKVQQEKRAKLGAFNNRVHLDSVS